MRVLPGLSVALRYAMRDAFARGARVGFIVVGACLMSALFLPVRGSAQVVADNRFSAPDSGASYRNAVDSLTPLVRANADAAARRGLVHALFELGRYDEAESAAAAGGNALARTLGDIQLARGRNDDALATYQRALAAHVADSASARLGIARIHYQSGDRVAATRELEWFIDFYNNAQTLSPSDLAAVGSAVTLLSPTDPQLVKDAIKAFEEAGKADARDVESRIREAALFIDKFDSRNGTPVIMEALAVEPANPRALVQLARAKQFDGNDQAMADVDRALAVNPQLTEALVLKADMLAASEDFSGAKTLAAKALAGNPNSLDAIATQAAVAYVTGDQSGYADAKRRFSSLAPHDTRLLTKTSQMAANERRFVESIALAREAVATDSMAWDARTLLGLGEFRLGRFDDASRTLAAAFKGDPYNPWVKNTLDLLDTFDQYRTVKAPRFNLVLNRREADLLSLYMQPLAEAAYDTFATRYHWRPGGDIRIEVYPRHADFSVRTVGLSGLGALGVSFGEILAMDSPSSRPIGEFHWASTMWHEIAHTFTLGLSNMKVPRWLTEGISGWEEARAHAGWGDPITPSFLSAYAAGKLPRVSAMTPAFVRPAYPEQVVHAYAMAELVVDEIAESRGVDAVRKLVAAFGQGKSQPDAFRDVLKTTPEQFDTEFEQYMQKRFAAAFAALQGGPQSAYAMAMSQGRSLLEAGQLDAAAAELERARGLFPDYAGPGSPYALMVELETKRGNDAATMTWLDRLTHLYAQNYNAWIQLSQLREKSGDAKNAILALEQAMLVHPFDPAQHDRLAKLYIAQRRFADAVRERRAIVALDPADKASAYYQLALALESAGDKASARSEVLRALEFAPGYAPAQELLLRLQGNS